MTKAGLPVLFAATLCATPAFAISNDDLRAALEQRFRDDRTGACVAAGAVNFFQDRGCGREFQARTAIFFRDQNREVA